MGQQTQLSTLLIGLSLVVGCGGQNDEAATRSFQISGALALAQTMPDAGDEPGDPSERSNLFALTAGGALEPAAENVTVRSMVTVRQGAYLELTDGARLFVETATDQEHPIAGTGTLIGQNRSDDLIFSDASIFRMANKTLEPLDTTLDGPELSCLSGNFAVLRDSQTVQIFDTLTTKRYNLMGCNGPGVAALAEDTALIDDCQGDQLMSLDSGARTDAITFFSLNHEFAEVDDGAVFISQSCPATQGDFGLCHIDPSGAMTTLLSAALSPGNASFCGAGPNQALFVAGDTIVIKELNKITYVERGIDEANTILSGLEITRIDVQGGRVFYQAEDNLGNPRVGIYDLETDTDSPIATPDSFADLQAMR